MKKVAIVGCGLRLLAFAKALKTTYSQTHNLAALVDIDPGKMRGFARWMELDVPLYTDFDKMCAETAPDLVIIGTVDVFHAGYICRALDKKIGVISEKPLCVNREQCLEIREACRRNPEVFAVTSHNSRYRPVAQTLKKLLDAGTVGKVLFLEYHEMLDRVHGKSYFRRWNSRRKFSNGLELHKSSHHFDKMNFLLGTRAVEVSAAGGLLAYGAKAPHKYEGVHCHDCPHREACPDFFAYEKKLFDSDMYTPDMCIWSPEIDIEDTFSASILFENGVRASYSLCAYADYEGEIINIQGTTGRLEARQLTYKSNVDDVHNMTSVPEESIKLFRFGAKEPEEMPIVRGEGAHGGADAKIFSELFAVPPAPSLPSIEDGIQAVLTGDALVRSIREKRTVRVQTEEE